MQAASIYAVTMRTYANSTELSLVGWIASVEITPYITLRLQQTEIDVLAGFEATS